MKKRYFYRAAVDEEGGKVMRQIARQSGMTVQAAMGRLISWFIGQPPAYRRMILGWADDPEIAARVTERLLAELNEKAQPVASSKADDLDSTLRIAEQLLTQLREKARQAKA
jgi:hypothetical protein